MTPDAKVGFFSNGFLPNGFGGAPSEDGIVAPVAVLSPETELFSKGLGGAPVEAVPTEGRDGILANGFGGAAILGVLPPTKA